MGYQILVCLAGLISGILIPCGIPGGRLLFYLVPPGLVGAWFLLAGRGWQLITRVRLMGFVLGFGCFFACGWVSVTCTTFRKAGLAPFRAEIAGRVISYRELTDKLGQIVVAVRQENAGGRWQKQAGRVVMLVKPQKPARFHRGEWWKFGPILFTPVPTNLRKPDLSPAATGSRGVCAMKHV